MQKKCDKSKVTSGTVCEKCNTKKETCAWNEIYNRDYVEDNKQIIIF